MADDSPDWLDPTELAAWMGLIKVSARILALSDGDLRRHHGITGRDYELLHHLSEHADTDDGNTADGDTADGGGRRISELAELIDDSSSCITHRVNRLAAAGLVVKRPHRHDQRGRVVALTGEGRALLAAAAPLHVERVRRWVIDPLTRRDVSDLARITARLRAHLRDTEPCTG